MDCRWTMSIALCSPMRCVVYVSTDVKRDRDLHHSETITRTKEAEVVPR
jgi:hypothetical protein